MSSPSYFFSYARRDATAKKGPSLVDDFFDDLLAEVRSLLPGADAFRDQRDIALGVPFADVILSALCSARAMLSVCSPAYFASEFCGKEWGLFQARARAAARAPATLIPVVWIPADTIPAHVRERQLWGAGMPSSYGQRGLRFLIQRKDENGHRSDYLDSVQLLARTLCDALKRDDLLLESPVVPTLEELSNVFADTRTASPVEPRGVALARAETPDMRTTSRRRFAVHPALLDVSDGPASAYMVGLDAGAAWWISADSPPGFTVERLPTSVKAPRGGVRISRHDDGNGAVGTLHISSRSGEATLELVARPLR